MGKCLKSTRNYLSMIVFAHTIFALPFAMIGFFLAIRYTGVPFSPTTLLLVILCMVFARSAAMGFNRWADRHFDQRNPRTRDREIPAGIIKSGHALTFTILSGMLFITCSALLNQLCFYLSPVALIIILGYSLTKRYTRWCHLILGLGLSLAPIGAYLAVTGTFSWIPVWFSLMVITWVSGFDIIYALQDVEFDRSQQLKSVPASYGIQSGLMISGALHVLTAAFVTVAGIALQLGGFYWAGAIIFIALLIQQHRLVSQHDLSRVNRAFGTTNGIASVLFALFVILSIYFR